MTEAAAVGRRERKKEETRHRIFEAALSLFNEKGFDATTIDDITERADVAKGTFFNYFPRKEAVVEYLAEEWMDQAEGTAGDASQPAAERLLRLYTGASKAYDEEPELARMVVHTAMSRFCCPAPDGAWQQFEALVMRVIREGQAKGELRGDVDPSVLYGILGSCFVGSLVWWLGPEDNCPARKYTLADVVRQLQLVAIDGMRPKVEA